MFPDKGYSTFPYMVGIAKRLTGYPEDLLRHSLFVGVDDGLGDVDYSKRIRTASFVMMLFSTRMIDFHLRDIASAKLIAEYLGVDEEKVLDDLKNNRIEGDDNYHYLLRNVKLRDARQPLET